MIDASITNITEAQKAVIAKYGFDLKDDNSHYLLIDPALKAKKKKGMTGRYISGNLNTILAEAVKLHKDVLGDPSDAVDPPAAATQPKPESALQQAKGNDPTLAIGKMQSEGQPDPIDEPPLPLGDTSAQAASPPAEIEGAELDNTGKRVRKAKKEKGERKVARYARAAAALAADPNIKTKQQLAKSANMAVATARNCLEAWNDYMHLLAEKGWYSGPAEFGERPRPAKKS